MSALLKLMNHESREIGTYSYEVIKGLAINGMTREKESISNSGC